MKTKVAKKSRRNFIKKGMMTMAGVSLYSSFIKPESPPTAKRIIKKENLLARTMGRTGMQVPVISYGCGATDNPNLVKAALDAGVILLDTAHSYGGGANETMLGNVLKGRPRQSFIVGTKFGIPQDMKTGLVPENINPTEFRAEMKKLVDESLKRLQLDYIDILYLHGIGKPEVVNTSLVKDVISEIRAEEKTKFLGISVHRNEPAVIRATVDAEIYDVILTAYNFRQPHRNEIESAIVYAANTDLGIVGMKMMAGVYWDRERKYPINAKAAMKWVLQNKNIHTIIPGITTFDQLEEDLAILENPTLTDQEKDDLKFGDKTAMSGLYCSQCGRCQIQCHNQLDIPTIMRCYMYAYGYRKPAKAKEILKKISWNKNFCGNCNSCSVSCTLGFNIQKKITEIIRLLDIPDDFLI